MLNLTLMLTIHDLLFLPQTCSKKHISMRCRQAEVLIIDEISMLGPRLFEVRSLAYLILSVYVI